MTKALSVHANQIEQAAHQIQTYLDGVSRERFLSNPLLQDAVAMRFVVIGEAASRLLQLDPTLPSRIPDVPWPQMRGLRNRLVHTYGAIDQDAVWETATRFLPILRAAMAPLILSLKDAPNG